MFFSALITDRDIELYKEAFENFKKTIGKK